MWRKRKSLIVYLVILLIVALLNVAAWNSTAFCDAYIRYVFPVWVNTYGRLTGLFPFSVGEMMLILGVLLALTAVLLGPVYGLLLAAGRVAGGWRRRSKALGTDVAAGDGDGGEAPEMNAAAGGEDGGKASGKKETACGGFRFVKGFYCFFVWVFLAVALVMTLNCFILYHASTFSEQYFGEETVAYSLEELLAVRNFVVEQCNSLAQQMDRGPDGNILYTGDMSQTAIESMRRLGQEYEQLDGYYPRPKPLYTSDFFCQQYMCGYYFPFSMEANYNDVMYIMNKPSTMCHELAHLRGYIFEDEANFISYLACIRSPDKVFAYSGYLSVLYYLDNDFYKAVGKDREAYLSQPVIAEQVIRDNVFVTQEEWNRINSKAWIDTETVDQVSDKLVDATLKVNGVADGMVSYSRVVELLLQYYRMRGI